MLHVNYARARSPASCALPFTYCRCLRSERGPATALSPIHRFFFFFFCLFSLLPPPHPAPPSQPPSLPTFPSLHGPPRSSSVRSRANIHPYGGEAFLRAIEIITINRRLSDIAKARTGSPRRGVQRERAQSMKMSITRGGNLYCAAEYPQSHSTV